MSTESFGLNWKFLHPMSVFLHNKTPRISTGRFQKSIVGGILFTRKRNNQNRTGDTGKLFPALPTELCSGVESISTVNWYIIFFRKVAASGVEPEPRALSCPSAVDSMLHIWHRTGYQPTVPFIPEPGTCSLKYMLLTYTDQQ